MKHCLRLSLSGRLPLSPWGPAVAIGGNEAPSYSLPSPVNMCTDSFIQSSDYVLSKNRMQINLLKQLTYPTAQSAARAVSGVISRPTYSPPLKIPGLAVIAMCSATSCLSQATLWPGSHVSANYLKTGLPWRSSSRSLYSISPIPPSAAKRLIDASVS
jgi:hypothetical protein